MPFENLISVSFSDSEITELDAALFTISRILLGKAINLTPEERQQYGSIAEQNKLFVNKAKELMELYPQHRPPFLDKDEFDRDYATRVQIEQRVQQLESLTEQFKDTKTALDHDNYFNALTFYRKMRYLSNENVPGTDSIYNAMKQFFIPVNQKAQPNNEKEA